MAWEDLIEDKLPFKDEKEFLQEPTNSIYLSRLLFHSLVFHIPWVSYKEDKKCTFHHFFLYSTSSMYVTLSSLPTIFNATTYSGDIYSNLFYLAIHAKSTQLLIQLLDTLSPTCNHKVHIYYINVSTNVGIVCLSFIERK